MYGFLLVFFSNFLSKTHRFWDIRLVSIPWPWNHGWGSLKVIKNYTIQCGTHGLLLTFCSNHRPISHHFWDKRQFKLKISHFSHPCVFNAPAEGVPLGIWYRHRPQKNGMMGLPNGQKSFKIGLAVQTQYRRVTDIRTHCDSNNCAMQYMHHAVNHPHWWRYALCWMFFYFGLGSLLVEIRGLWHIF